MSLLERSHTPLEKLYFIGQCILRDWPCRPTGTLRWSLPQRSEQLFITALKQENNWEGCDKVTHESTGEWTLPAARATTTAWLPSGPGAVLGRREWRRTSLVVARDAFKRSTFFPGAWYNKHDTSRVGDIMSCLIHVFLFSP